MPSATLRRNEQVRIRDAFVRSDDARAIFALVAGVRDGTGTRSAATSTARCIMVMKSELICGILGASWSCISQALVTRGRTESSKGGGWPDQKIPRSELAASAIGRRASLRNRMPRRLGLIGQIADLVSKKSGAWRSSVAVEGHNFRLSLIC
jgi:hypothetical protein